MNDMPAMLFISLRFLLASAVVAPLAFYERTRVKEPITRQQYSHFFILGFVFFAGMSAQQVGLLGTTVTNAGFLTTLYVVMVPLLLFVVFRQRHSGAVWICAITSLVGVFLLSGGNLSKINWGDWLIVLCAFFWAIHVILVSRFSRQTNRPIALAVMQFFVCGCVACVAHLVSDAMGWTEPTLSWQMLTAALPEIAYAGILAGGLAFTLQIVAQRYTNPSVAAILLGTESLFAAIFGAIIVGDRLTSIGYVGCGLIFAAVLAVEILPMPVAKRPNE